MKRASLGHYVLGLEGLALLRTWLTGDPAALEARIEEIRKIVNNPAAPPLAIRFDTEEFDFRAGYASWAAHYDAMPNPLIHCEESVVQALIDRSPPGMALDAACGTGRHTAYLAAKGHHVLGVDGSPDMLAKAQARLPQVEFRTGDLTALPVETASMDLVVCALAVAHFRDLTAPMRELARVTRPGGRVVLSDQHPLAVALGGEAFFFGPDGKSGFVKNHFHTHSAYLKAFVQAGLEVRDCAEPPFGPEEIELLARALSAGESGCPAEAVRAAAGGLPSGLIWELIRRE
jgi:ubiquinone/menaquinone biosynthesis C-methylase UbiE